MEYALYMQYIILLYIYGKNFTNNIAQMSLGIVWKSMQEKSSATLWKNLLNPGMISYHHLKQMV